MNKHLKLTMGSAVVGVALAVTATAPAFAWHPKGVITKYVQNQTEGGQMADANDAKNAVSAKPGQLLKYTIVIENKGTMDSKGWNDMHFTKLTDTLPAGVELVSNPAQRSITEDLGVVKAGQKVTKEYVVKVTSAKDGDLIENKACFVGNSEVKDNKQEGCDTANVKISVPTPPELPKTPEQPKPQVLPVTGPANVLGAAGAASVLGYAANLIRLKRRAER